METEEHPSSRRYPPEMKERVVRMVEETIAESGERWGTVSRIARQLGIGEQTLRNPVERAEIDTGRRPGTTDEKASQDRRAGKGSPRAAAGQSDPQVGVSGFFRVYVKRSSTAPSRSGLQRRPS